MGEIIAFLNLETYMNSCCFKLTVYIFFQKLSVANKDEVLSHEVKGNNDKNDVKDTN